ncbi:hypothetical protein ACFYWP_34330 [Actinacidiphila glaucinigra]|uniref:hypothetical protein n=1 Tax=Actinacidiphila glaucinigra TaxID=235986 RepID=UPI00367B55CA
MRKTSSHPSLVGFARFEAHGQRDGISRFRASQASVRTSQTHSCRRHVQAPPRRTSPCSARFTGAYRFDQPYGTQMAAGVLVTVPLVVAARICRRRVIAGLTAGGVK